MLFLEHNLYTYPLLPLRFHGRNKRQMTWNVRVGRKSKDDESNFAHIIDEGTGPFLNS